MRNRTGKACLAVAGFLTLFGGVSPPAIAQERPLEGQVIDARGTGVSGATIFLTAVGRPRYATDTLARTHAVPATADGAGGPAVPGSGVTSRVTGGVDVSF